MVKSPYSLVNVCQLLISTGPIGPRLYGNANAGMASPGMPEVLVVSGVKVVVTNTPGRNGVVVMLLLPTILER